MTRDLASMDFTELGRLFPIIICNHNPLWHDAYNAERKLIEMAIGQDFMARIQHFGSTAVPYLVAKPTIDILMEIRENAEVNRIVSSMESIGYLHSPQPDNPAPHLMFMKGYTPEGFKGQAYHVHLRYSGDWDELYFRDFLIAHPDIANEYGRLKKALKQQYTYDREAYTQGKTEFVQRITDLARKELGDRYVPPPPEY